MGVQSSNQATLIRLNSTGPLLPFSNDWVVKRWTCTSKQESLLYTMKLKSKIYETNKYVQRVHSVSFSQEISCTTAYYEITATVDSVDSDRTFASDLRRRAKSGSLFLPYSEQQLRDILICCCKGVFALIENQAKLDTFDLNWLYRSESGKIRVIDPEIKNDLTNIFEQNSIIHTNSSDDLGNLIAKSMIDLALLNFHTEYSQAHFNQMTSNYSIQLISQIHGLFFKTMKLSSLARNSEVVFSCTLPTFGSRIESSTDKASMIRSTKEVKFINLNEQLQNSEITNKNQQFSSTFSMESHIEACRKSIESKLSRKNINNQNRDPNRSQIGKSARILDQKLIVKENKNDTLLYLKSLSNQIQNADCHISPIPSPSRSISARDRPFRKKKFQLYSLTEKRALAISPFALSKSRAKPETLPSHIYQRLHFDDGGIYEGYFRNSKMDGYGILTYPSGQIAYQGHWKDGGFHGIGKLFRDLTHLSLKDFNSIDSLPHPHIFESGFLDTRILLGVWKSYEGEFNMDSIEGKGILTLLNGERIHGQWYKNRLVVGSAIYKYSKPN